MSATPNASVVVLQRVRPAATTTGAETTASVASAVMLRFADRRYWFGGVGETAQRVAAEHRIRLSKTHHVFLTRTAWSHLGGLPGMLMTLADAAPAHTQLELNLFGPPNLSAALASMHYFLTRLLPRRHRPTHATAAADADGHARSILGPLRSLWSTFRFRLRGRLSHRRLSPNSAGWNSTTNVNLVVSETFPEDRDDAVPVFKDANITVSAVTITSSSSQSRTTPTTSTAQSHAAQIVSNMFSNDALAEVDQEAGGQRKKARKGNLLGSDIDVQPDDTSLVYIVKLAAPQGRLNVDKAQHLGVTKGPMFRDLKAGLSVTLSDGRIVHASDCLDATRSSETLLFVCCPSLDHLPSLLSSRVFQPMQPGSGLGDAVVVVYHMSPPHVLADPRYRDWAALFGLEAKHVLCDNAFEAVFDKATGKETQLRHTFEGSTVNHNLMRHIQPGLFPPLSPALTSPEIQHLIFAHSFFGGKWPCEPPVCTPARLFTTLVLRPGRGLLAQVNADKRLREETLVVAQDDPDFIGTEQEIAQALHELEVRPGFREELQRYIQNCSADETVQAATSPNSWVVTCLGTGSAIPSRYRNVSATLVHMDDERHGSLLLDCGEGTVTQLLRITPEDESSRSACFQTIKAVLISHMHADHHLGLLTLLHERSSYTMDPLDVVGPAPLGDFLQRYGQVEHLPPYRFTSIAASGTPEGLPVDLLASLGLRRLTSVPVKHCPQAFGFVLEHFDGFKLVYSGDTRPCAALVTAGMDCDLLIHEATFEDGMEAEAESKRHSTVGEAMLVSTQMRAKRVLLTHFSQRYPKAPQVFNSDPRTFPDYVDKGAVQATWARTGFASDLLQVRARTFPQLVHLKALLAIVFPAEEDTATTMSDTSTLDPHV